MTALGLAKFLADSESILSHRILDVLSTTHAEALKSLMTLNFQRFEDVSLMTA
jgi:hypothetical protein